MRQHFCIDNLAQWLVPGAFGLYDGSAFFPHICRNGVAVLLSFSEEETSDGMTNRNV